MRITEKKENNFYELKNGQEIYGEENGIRLVQIVGSQEDKQDLCDKIYENQKIYAKDVFGQVTEVNCCNRFVGYDTTREKIVISGINGGLAIKDYGKNWALTKEELTYGK